MAQARELTLTVGFALSVYTASFQMLYTIVYMSSEDA